MRWKGPFRLGDLLDKCLEEDYKPPESGGVYLVSKSTWHSQPTKGCHPIYVGGNTGRSVRFRTRIGDLIADIFGFFSDETGHHSGGITIYKYLKSKKVQSRNSGRSWIHPKQLWIGWLEDCGCVRCEENRVYDELKPELNQKRPNKCKKHSAK